MKMTGTEDKVLSCRRALEALRSGVPNRDAVEILGCNQPHVERKFRELITSAAKVDDRPSSSLSMLVEGDFGSGKSHLLGHLEHMALTENFVCSRIAISKETPLFTLDKVFRSAIDHAVLPDRTGQLIEEIAQGLKPDTEAYTNFFVWANSDDSGVSPLFPATLAVHERAHDFELQNEIQSFWSGNPIRLPDVRRGLRQINQLQHYSFKRPKASELALQRLHFVLELIKGAGYSGWVILLDELELIANYSLLQRGRSYAELARWMGKVADDEYPGLVTVGTITEDYVLRVLQERGDLDYVGPRFRARGDDVTAARAESGMVLLEREKLKIEAPDLDVIHTALERLREIYSIAYGWDAPRIEAILTGAGSQRRMRYHVRKAINEWDLIRLYPDARPDTEETGFTFNYEEDLALEQETRDDIEEPGPDRGHSNREGEDLASPI